MKCVLVSGLITLAMSTSVMAGSASALDITGVLQFEAGETSTAGTSTSDIGLATAEIGIMAQVNEQVSAALVFLHEEDETPFGLDVASISYQLKDSDWSISGGQVYLPFGLFASNMVSDSLTHDIGEIRETALQFDYQSGALFASLFLFNGDDKSNKNNTDKIDNFGFSIEYEHQGDLNITAHLSYLNDLANTDGLQDVVGGTTDEYVAAATLAVVLERGDLSFIIEHVTALDNFTDGELDFNGSGAKPAATTLELGYALTIAGKPAMLAIGQQTSAEAVALGLAESRTMLALNIELLSNTRLAFELSNSKDYAAIDGGSGDASDSFTAQLSVEF